MFQNISELIDLQELIDDGMITKRQHPFYKLYIYNYTNRAQYDNKWAETTKLCRGLIVDKDGNIVSRPFKKFFNIEQLTELPSINFRSFEKMDGSLGISYFWNNDFYVASRGSFISEQANVATVLLKTKYRDIKLNPDYTYLWEIIYPENRIVINYGDWTELVLLAIVETKTGIELGIPNIGFLVPGQYIINDIAEFQKLNLPNQEGVVLQFEDGSRAKVKFDEYKRLHKLLTGITAYNIWECLANNVSMDHLLDNVPDEFYKWVKDEVESFTKQFRSIENQCQQILNNAQLKYNTRKELAQVFIKYNNYSAILFLMLDKRDYTKMIYKQFEPKRELCTVMKIEL